MLTREKILDDVARFAGGTVGAVSGLRKQVKDDIRSHIDDLALRIDLVPREEFERMEALLKSSLKTQEKLNTRIAALEETVAALNKKSKRVKK